MNCTNATCTKQMMYARVNRWRDRESAPLNGSSIELTTVGGTPSSLSSGSNSKTVSTRTLERQKKRERQQEVLNLFMPAWLDHDKTIATLSKRPLGSSTNYAQDKFAGKVEAHYREEQFKVAFKEVQRMIKENRSSDPGAMQPKKGKGIHAVIAEVSKDGTPGRGLHREPEKVDRAWV